MEKMDSITLYASQDLRTLDRGSQLDTLDMPQDELTGNYEYIVERAGFMSAYDRWNRDERPLLKVRDQLSDTDIYLGGPSARRVREAIQKNEASVQLF